MQGTCRLHSGFSLLELVIVVCIIATLATLAMKRMTSMRLQAEQSNVEVTIGNLRSALGIKVAEEISKGRQSRIAELAGSNPMDQVSEAPETYRGAFYGIDPALFDGGQWYFDKRDKTLVYRVKFEDAIETSLPGPARIRYSISLVFDDKDGNQRYSPDVDRLTGLRLSAMEHYRWLVK